MGERPPDFQAACGLLQYLPIAELNAYMEEESKVDEMIRDLPQVKEWDSNKELLLASNKSLAESNYKMEPKLTALKNVLVERSALAQALLEELTEKRSLLDTTGSPKSPDSVLAVLQADHAKLDENSEDLASKFLNSDITVEAFLDSYPKMRREAHVKRVKVDKMKELLRNRRISTASVSSSNMTPYPSRSAPLPPVSPQPTPPYPVHLPPGAVPVFPGMPYGRQ